LAGAATEVDMQNGLVRLTLLGILLVLGFLAARPYIEYRLYATTTPQPVEARGNLADFERLTIDIFERVSPSVVQVVGRAGGNELGVGGGEANGAQSGTGLVWDGAGHIVTNDHVVQGTTTLAVRLSSGDVGNAAIVGVAPN